MRTYIQPLKKSTEDEIKVRVERDVAKGLKDYCEFLQSPPKLCSHGGAA
ncbi:MAG TPA: hypothetical protein VEX68_26630 [Bryobacteraceae bacterium]|nr:hypothetical protein [Bryobacteraceae bacterium]